MSNRVEWVDNLKGFAILSVVFSHVVDGFIKAGTYAAANGQLSMIRNFLNMYQMPLFFILSGYVFERAYWKSKAIRNTRYWKQLTNIVLLYFLWTGALYIAKILASAFTNTITTPKDLLLAPFIPSAIYWYLYVLAELYVIFGIVKVHKMDERIALPIVGLLALIGSWLMSKPDVQWLGLTKCVYYIPFFYFGILLQRHHQKLKPMKYAWGGGRMLPHICCSYCL